MHAIFTANRPTNNHLNILNSKRDFQTRDLSEYININHINTKAVTTHIYMYILQNPRVSSGGSVG